jgi:hypothetical protein
MKTVLHDFLGKDITLSHLFLLLEIVKFRLSKGKNKDFCLVVAGIMSLVAKLTLIPFHIYFMNLTLCEQSMVRSFLIWLPLLFNFIILQCCQKSLVIMFFCIH